MFLHRPAIEVVLVVVLKLACRLSHIVAWCIGIISLPIALTALAHYTANTHFHEDVHVVISSFFGVLEHHITSQAGGRVVVGWVESIDSHAGGLLIASICISPIKNSL